MAVSFTSNIGLAKPDKNELAKNWVTNTDLSSFNNAIITDKMNIPQQTYSVSITAAGGAPNIGGGSTSGRFQECQGYVWGTFIVIFANPSINAGVGEYAISLPYPIDSSFHWVATSFSTVPGAFSVIGEGYTNDASTPNNSGSVAIDACNFIGIGWGRLITETFSGKTNRLFSPGQPFTVDHADSLTGNFFYKKA